jgi:glycosyltransferase involved in cell wall biosynthesis
MGAPLVSVVIPAFNSAEHIGDALNSVLAQSYTDIEIIVVDDGSTDDTVGIVKQYERVQLLQQANQGSAVARNLGINHAQGDYIAFLDSDDVWWSGKISLQMAELQRTGLEMAYSRFIWWHPDPEGNYSPPESEFESPTNPNISNVAIVTGWTYAELLLDCIVWTSTVLVKKDKLIRSGLFNPSFRKGQDYDLWLRLSRIVPMLGIDQPTALYRIHPNSITHHIAERCYEYEILSRAVENWGETGPDLRHPPAGTVEHRLARILLNHGNAHARSGNPRIAIKAFREMFRKYHLNPKALLLLGFAYLKLAQQSVAGKRPRSISR